MICEYPDYYEKFHCIGGSCPDTCCAGWEVDVDEESLNYYKSLEGPFGDRLRSHLKEENDEVYFPLTKENRCPFLNKSNLCDIYIELGEESLCQVCTEYPRYFMDVGNYEQIDMSLSCMELGRIFFSDPGPVHYIRSENDVLGEELAPEEENELVHVLALRNEAIEILQEIPARPLTEQLKDVISLIEDAVSLDPSASSLEGEEANVLSAAYHHRNAAFISETADDLLQLMTKLEVLDERWTNDLDKLGKCAETDFNEQLKLFKNTLGSQGEHWFRRLSVYFVYRYFIDASMDGDLMRSLRILIRSLRIILRMAVLRFKEQGGSFTQMDMADVCHLYSKEVEHSDDNVEIMKAPFDKG
jgi:lysine-N-methylase